jgi:hypothetical protein
LPLTGSPPQPQIYRTIIDDVIASVQVDFEEYGMEEEVLNNLQAVRGLERVHSGFWLPSPVLSSCSTVAKISTLPCLLSWDRFWSRPEPR